MFKKCFLSLNARITPTNQEMIYTISRLFIRILFDASIILGYNSWLFILTSVLNVLASSNEMITVIYIHIYKI